MSNNEYKISLRFRHPSLDPVHITSALGFTPSRCWRAGEPRHTPKGTPLGGNYSHSYWTARFAEGRWPGRSLAEAMSDLVDQLQARKDFFRQISSGGGKAELFVGWFFEGRGGVVFDCDLLSRMADLGIDLSLDIYPPNQAE
jgi:hypothetical protein